MKYCKQCMNPESRPKITFDEDGICNYCQYFNSTKRINWEERKKELIKIAEEAKSKKRDYDCVVGVSGGKDSTYMALYARDVLGLKVLLVNMIPDSLTEIGRHNMNNLQSMGFDCALFRPNPKVCKKLARDAFFKHLNPVKPSEYALYATPVRFAIMYKVPLVLFDINFEGDIGAKDASTIYQSNTLGYTGSSSHLLCEGVTKEDLAPYEFPSKEDIEKSGLKVVYLAYYDKWSAHAHGMFSLARGMHQREDNLEDIGRYTRYHALDDDGGIMNQMLKHIKFGFGYATEEANADIWSGRITRREAIELIEKYDGKCSVKYIQQFCDYIGITLDEFWNHTDKFRGKMWKKNNIGEWVLDNPIWEQE